MNISGMFLGIYSLTYGLAGPAVAIQQVLSVFTDTVLAMLIKGHYPDVFGIISILCLVVAAVIMSVELPCEKQSTASSTIKDISSNK